MLRAPDTANRYATRWLAAIIVVAVLLRVATALYMGDRVIDMPGVYDQISYDGLAQRVVAGHGFSFGTDWWPATRAGEPTAHWSFLYTLYLSAAYALAGHHPLVPRLIQALAGGILLPWLTYRLAGRVAGRVVSLAAAAISAAYIYFFYYGAALMTETFFIIASLGSLNLAMAVAERPTWARWAGLGVVMGCAVLLRQTFMLFAPFLLLWIAWAARRYRPAQAGHRWTRFLVPLAVIGLMILPWTLRNYRVFHQFVLLNTNAGYVMFWSNHPIQGASFKSLLGEGDPSYYELIPAELLPLDEAALEKALLSRGIGFVLAEPGRYALLSLSRVKDYFLFWPKPSSGMLSNISRVGSFGICLPFMLYGLALVLARSWRGRRILRRDAQGQALVLLYAFVAVYTAAHLLTWAYVRYRLPVDAVLVVFAAIGLYDLRMHLRHLRNLRIRLSPIARADTPKRLLDLALAVPLLILLSPLLLVLALIVRLDSPGPVLYRRRVMGRGGGQFDAFKFRTMCVDGDAVLARHPELLAQWQRDQKVANDPRVTGCGCWMRRLSLDELPQLFNVLAGQMSLVGPRMVVESELARYAPCIDELLSVRPGITGLWQVSGRGEVQGDARACLELEYVRTRCLQLDIKLLLLTVPAMLGRRGAF